MLAAVGTLIILGTLGAIPYGRTRPYVTVQHAGHHAPAYAYEYIARTCTEFIIVTALRPRVHGTPVLATAGTLIILGTLGAIP